MELCLGVLLLLVEYGWTAKLQEQIAEPAGGEVAARGKRERLLERLGEELCQR
jgi:hypothetical protein